MFSLLFIIILCILSPQCTTAYENKHVCEHFPDYATYPEENPNCWYDPDVGATCKEVAERHGASFESYEVETDDGYILTVFRLPNQGKKVVLLLPGVGADCQAYFIAGGNSIPHCLYNSSYDVWILNTRGTKYSAKHVSLSVYDKRYWDFSFDEKGRYDLPPTLELIADVTGQKGNFSVVAHAEGVSMVMVYGSLKPKHAAKYVKFVFQFGPLVFMGNSGSPFSRSVIPLCPAIKKTATAVGLYAIGPNIQWFLDGFHAFCSTPPFLLLCFMIHCNFDGCNFEKERASSYPIAFKVYPSGLSMQTIDHYCQFMKCDRFQMYNENAVPSCTEEEYPIEKVPFSVYVYCGSTDLTAKTEDCKKLLNRLNPSVVAGYKETSHTHYTMAYASNEEKKTCEFLKEKLREHSD